MDKVKQRDFVYHNEVIKPALGGCWDRGSPVGLSLTGRNTIPDHLYAR